MAADVAKGPDLAVVAVQDEHGLVARVGGQVAAGLGKVADMPGVLPGALEDRVQLALEDQWIGVVAGDQGGPDRPLGNAVGGGLGLPDGFGCDCLGHGRVLSLRRRADFVVNCMISYRLVKTERRQWLSITPEPEGELPAAHRGAAGRRRGRCRRDRRRARTRRAGDHPQRPPRLRALAGRGAEPGRRGGIGRRRALAAREATLEVLDNHDALALGITARAAAAGEAEADDRRTIAQRGQTPAAPTGVRPPPSPRGVRPLMGN